MVVMRSERPVDFKQLCYSNANASSGSRNLLLKWLSCTGVSKESKEADLSEAVYGFMGC
jgi:hypothetical protein